LLTLKRRKRARARHRRRCEYFAHGGAGGHVVVVVVIYGGGKPDATTIFFTRVRRNCLSELRGRPMRAIQCIQIIPRRRRPTLKLERTRRRRPVDDAVVRASVFHRRVRVIAAISRRYIPTRNVSVCFWQQ